MGRAKRAVPKKLASKLTAIREELGLTMTALAEELSDSEVRVSRKDVSKFESGEREPNLIILLRYARLTKISMEHMVDDNQDLPFR